MASSWRPGESRSSSRSGVTSCGRDSSSATVHSACRHSGASVGSVEALDAATCSASATRRLQKRVFPTRESPASITVMTRRFAVCEPWL